MATNDIFVGIDGTTPSWTKAVHFDKNFDEPMSFVNCLYQASVAPKENKHNFAGPDLFGNKVPECISLALQNIIASIRRLPVPMAPRITIVGYSRGAYAAIRVAQGLKKAGYRVYVLALIDTVKVTDSGVEARVAEVLDKYDDSYDLVAEGRELDKRVSEAASRSGASRYGGATSFPGGAKVLAAGQGTRLVKEVYVQDARDAAKGSGNFLEMPGHFVLPNNIDFALHVQRDDGLGSHQNNGASAWRVILGRALTVMGTAPVAKSSGTLSLPPRFWCTHSAMGGMPYRGDLEEPDVSRRGEWIGTAKVARVLSEKLTEWGVINGMKHPTLMSPSMPPTWWSDHPFITGRPAPITEAERRKLLEMNHYNIGSKA